MFSFFRPKSRQALFICGCGHTGTTLVANIFAAHPDVFVPLLETGAFLKPRKARASYRRLRAEADASGKPYMVEKTPRHVLHLDLIRHLAPGARFLIMMRDGRDVAASFIKRKGSPEEGIARWIEAGRIIERERFASDVHLLRYEDLVAAPRASVEVAADFAGIPFSEAMLNHHLQERHWFGQTETRKGAGHQGSEHRALRNWQVNQPIFDGRGAWVGKLQQPTIDVFEGGEASPLMRTFGYLAEARG